MLGTLLHGRYRIIRVLGSGGFGQTYVAEDIQHPEGLRCVVKQFKPSRQDEHFLQIARRLFSSEVETLRKLGSHSQIPSLLDDFEENQEFYLVQEYIEGQLLSDELSAIGRLDEADVVAMLRDVLHVLKFVHQNQVIHRDIKPSNLIRRQQDGKYVLIDFGAVKEIQTQITTVPGQTNLTVGIGTQGYGPSEQLMGKPRYSSDLYALGMTAIHALTGLQPAQLPTHPKTGEVVWLDAVEVSPKLAAILTRMTRYHFSQRYQSAEQVLEAVDSPTEIVLDQPTEVPPDEPTDLWTETLTDTTQVPKTQIDRLGVKTFEDASVTLSGKQDRSKVSRWPVSVGVASIVVTAFVLGIRQLGWLQPLELSVFDRMVQVSPDLGPDPRLLVVGITEADIQAQKQFPLPDGVIAQALKTLKSLQPRAIGLDLLRNLPIEPGNQSLLNELKASNVIAITNLGDSVTPPPPGVPPARVGFNDVPLDPGDIVRRNLMFAHLKSKDTDFYSFSLRLALKYLAAEGITLKPSPLDENLAQLGQATFKPLERDAGGYQAIDTRGYQILLKYRSRNVARQVSLGEVLSGKVKPEWVRDKVVLIGTTAPTEKDLFSTPYSSATQDVPRMAGVLIHAQMVSQFLDAALQGRSLFWFWHEGIEGLWIFSWAITGAVVAWFIRRPVLLVAGGTLLLLLLGGVCLGLFTQMGWVPVAAPAIAAIAAGGMVMAGRGSEG
jgi:CHASE2 domain-containing sensor protein/serine/threonine protein kinase